ncbi:pilus assembly protein TadG-related protein [Sulfuriflexus sp.]|uniref:pilus assembly protein TadG-related protein n=1 Tax=Sulfuriflexus sp. TaxID=2015443 RepID=UPI0028CF2100|nr:pilus assembly protein TadG-related protein [Sulfuriflexus sp.]MDT8403038.1 pilus assembly protein TadG-related protein [Sulfuriflexus sp.]
MNGYSRKQQGATLVMTAIFIVVLVGIAALALDLGRLFVLRTEVQNAVDAAATAAAAELDSGTDARLRARQASRELLVDRGIFLGQFTADDDLQDGQYTFYSSIDPVKVLATNDGDARFVDITIDLTGPGEGIQLFFLPVLQLLGETTPLEQGLAARALAGRQTVVCIKPPFLMCFDDVTNFNSTDESTWPMQPGEMVRLRQHGDKGSSWVPGNFAFLIPAGSKGAPDLAEFLAGAVEESCDPPKITSAPGQKAQPSRRGFNTRFDLYEGKFTAAEYPPAPNVINYPRDNDILAAILAGDDAPRIGSGIWDRVGYWNRYHAALAVRPAGYETWSRHRTYQWELGLIGDNGAPVATPGSNTEFPADRVFEPAPGPGPYANNRDDLGIAYNCDPNDKDYRPTLCHGEPVPAHFYCPDGDTTCDNYQVTNNIYPTVAYPLTPPIFPSDKTEGVTTNVKRRVMHVAALDCELLNLHGNINDLEVSSLNGRFLEFFMTQHAEDPGPSPDKFELYSEFIGLTEDTGDVRVVIQLYE